MGGKKKYIEMFGSFTEPFNLFRISGYCRGIHCSTCLSSWVWDCVSHPFLRCDAGFSHRLSKKND